MKPAIRRATPDDLAAMVALEARCPGSAGWNEAAISAELGRDNADLYVAADPDGALVGLSIGWADGGTSEVLDVAVDPARRRERLGRQLMDALLTAARARGALESFLEVRTDNVAAIALYFELGYQPVGRRSEYYPDGHDALVLKRLL